MKPLIVTADDFGAAIEVNDAVEIAHTSGILTAASLMVTAPAAGDAVSRARRLPRLAVGLHLVLVDGRPALPAHRIPDLVDRNGRFHDDMGRLSWRLLLSARTRRQCRDEIDEQFTIFSATGLEFDHVDAHQHFHVHPIVGTMVIEAAVRHGVRALRAPVEPGRPKGSGWLAFGFACLLRRRARARGLLVPDRVFGLAHSGRMTSDRIASALASLPGDVAELYLHPATCNDFPGHAPGYQHVGELAGLTSPRSRMAALAHGVRLTTFSQLALVDSR